MSNGLGRMARIGVFAASIAMVVACGSNGDPDEGDESPSPMSPSPTSPSPSEITGLRLIAARDGRYYAVPIGWSAKTDHVYVLREADGMRIELTPGVQ